MNEESVKNTECRPAFGSNANSQTNLVCSSFYGFAIKVDGVISVYQVEHPEDHSAIILNGIKFIKAN